MPVQEVDSAFELRFGGGFGKRVAQYQGSPECPAGEALLLNPSDSLGFDRAPRSARVRLYLPEKLEKPSDAQLIAVLLSCQPYLCPSGPVGVH